MNKAKICKNCIHYNGKMRSPFKHLGEGYCMKGRFWTGDSEYMHKDCVRLRKEKRQ